MTMKIGVSKKMLTMFEEEGELEEFLIGMKSLGIDTKAIKTNKNKTIKKKNIQHGGNTPPPVV